MTPSALFLKQVETFLKRTGMSPTAFGKAVCSDPNFVPDLRKGRKPNLDLVETVHRFMAEYGALFESNSQ